MLRIFVWILSTLLFLLLLVFALNNLDPVTLKFAGKMSWEAPLIILILVVFAAGCFVGMFAMLPFAWKKRRKNKKQKNQKILPVK